MMSCGQITKIPVVIPKKKLYVDSAIIPVKKQAENHNITRVNLQKLDGIAF